VDACVVEGSVTINGEKMGKRDGRGIWNIKALSVNASENARVLLMEVPMTL